jgi:hypothetical protein
MNENSKKELRLLGGAVLLTLAFLLLPLCLLSNAVSVARDFFTTRFG